MKVLMTIDKFAKKRNVTRMTVYRWLKLKKIEAYRSPNGKHWNILEDIR